VPVWTPNWIAMWPSAVTPRAGWLNTRLTSAGVPGSFLKVRYNKVFGYYVEVSRANLGAVPPDYIRKQTLVNAERFITEQLKVFETQVLEAEEKRQELEERLFAELRSAVAAEARRIQAMAEVLAEIDGLSDWRKWRLHTIIAARSSIQAASSISSMAAIR